jgi:hypothetical protein
MQWRKASHMQASRTDSVGRRPVWGITVGSATFNVCGKAVRRRPSGRETALRSHFRERP